VVGLGTAYGVYLLFRNGEERRLGRSAREALETTARRAGPGMLGGALTAAGTFYVLMLTDFPGIRELGFIAGTSIILAWLSMMTLLPALVLVTGRGHVERRRETGPQAVQLVARITRHPRVVVGLAAVAGALSVVALRGVRFDYNRLHLQARGTESVDWEERILRSAGRPSFVALSTAGSLDELRQRVAAFEALDSVSEVESVLSLIPADQEAKAKILAEIAPIVEPVAVGPRERVDLPRLLAAVRALRQRLHLAADEAPSGHDRDEVVALRDETAALARKLEQTPPAAAPTLATLQDQLRADFARTLGRLKRNLHPTPIGLADVPGELRRKFVGQSGRFLLQIQPKVDIWDRDGAERFVCALPFNLGNVFGFPLILGAGAEFGLNVVLRYGEARQRGGPRLPRSTFFAVLVNGLTTVVGFGSLMIAAHRGIFGLGLLLTL